MTKADKIKIASMFQQAWKTNNEFGFLFKTLKAKNVHIKKIVIEPCQSIEGFKEKAYTVTVNFLTQDLNETRLTFYANLPEIRKNEIEAHFILSIEPFSLL